jgi:hypothetical protein
MCPSGYRLEFKNEQDVVAVLAGSLKTSAVDVLQQCIHWGRRTYFSAPFALRRSRHRWSRVLDLGHVTPSRRGSRTTSHQARHSHTSSHQNTCSVAMSSSSSGSHGWRDVQSLDLVEEGLDILMRCCLQTCIPSI